MSESILSKAGSVCVRSGGVCKTRVTPIEARVAINLYEAIGECFSKAQSILHKFCLLDKEAMFL